MSYNNPVNSIAEYGVMKTGAGLTSINGVVSASTGLLNYGFFTGTTQTNPIANKVNIITFNISAHINGISLVGSTAITVANAGVYTKLFTASVFSGSSNDSTISFWLRYNGADVPLSRQDLEMDDKNTELFVTDNFTLNMDAGSNIQVCWSSPETSVSLALIPTAINPVRPSGASTKLTLTRIS
jgi:hypothetical protein